MFQAKGGQQQLALVPRTLCLVRNVLAIATARLSLTTRDMLLPFDPDMQATAGLRYLPEATVQRGAGVAGGEYRSRTCPAMVANRMP